MLMLYSWSRVDVHTFLEENSISPNQNAIFWLVLSNIPA